MLMLVISLRVLLEATNIDESLRFTKPKRDEERKDPSKGFMLASWIPREV
jgi:hypothetical protein